jgi:asparagine synthase (glutamine-hydrolysing)
VNSRNQHPFCDLETLPPESHPYERLLAKIQAINDFEQRPDLDQLTLIDVLLELPERLLMRLDKATMRYSVEARVPFLDSAVMDVVFRASPNLRGAARKNFLKRFASKKLPPRILSRRKLGFPTSKKVFLAPQVLSRIRDAVLESRFIQFTQFDSSRINELIGSRVENTVDLTTIWPLYKLSLWFHHWVERS